MAEIKVLTLKDPNNPDVLKHTTRNKFSIRVVNVLLHCDLLLRCTLCGHHFPENYRHFPLKQGFQAW